MSTEQWGAFLAVFIPLIVAITSLVVAETERVRWQNKQHEENSRKLDDIAKKLNGQ